MRKLIALTALVAAFVLLPALAQAADTVVDFTDPVFEILAVVVSLVLGLAFLVLIWLARLIKEKTGIDIEAKLLEIEARHRDALHSAVMTQVKAAQVKYGIDLKLDVGSPQAKYIIDGIMKSVPDAVKALGPTEEWILKAAAAKLGAPPVQP